MQLNMMHKSVGGTIICKELKACLLADDIPENLPSKVPGYKMNIQKLVTFLVPKHELGRGHTEGNHLL
jgi:hypothetical protein